LGRLVFVKKRGASPVSPMLEGRGQQKVGGERRYFTGERRDIKICTSDGSLKKKKRDVTSTLRQHSTEKNRREGRKIRWTV